MAFSDFEFRTRIPFLDCSGWIEHSTPMMLVGSCFSSNIGKKLKERWFDVISNPFGPLYNPASIAMWLERLIENRRFEESELFFNGEVYGSYWCHTILTDCNASFLLDKLNHCFDEARSQLLKSKIMIVTLGTAYAYSLICSGEIVANCHKMPASNFLRQKLDLDDIVSRLQSSIEAVRNLNPNLRFIFTVSPIRHLSDGFHENQLSKASLLLAIDRLIAMIDGVSYYPSYEIMMDDLRDYRFYDSDMSHPSEVAIQYIYEHFARSFQSEECMVAAAQCLKLTNRMSHRHRTDSPQIIEKFEKETIRIKDALIARYPYLGRLNNMIL